ncbi:hypothetical protein GF366_02760 [Candidatus Peregrinibacteria bacterium]|nr:hypothetical protein [Candidatus Peregrinibacteria bacterium]
MKKIFLSVVSALFLSPAVFASFSDVPTTHTYYDSINYVQSEGIVDGYPDGTYRPDNLINRAEFTKIVIGTAFYGYLYYGENPLSECSSSDFPDVPKDEWFYMYVCIADNKGIIDGYPDGTFKPAGNINFAEAAKIIVNALPEYEAGQTGGEWFTPFVSVLEANDAVPPTVYSNDKLITRGEMAYIIHVLRGGGAGSAEMFDTIDGYVNLVLGENSEEYITEAPVGYELKWDTNMTGSGPEVYLYLEEGYDTELRSLNQIVEFYLHKEDSFYGPFYGKAGLFQ